MALNRYKQSRTTEQLPNLQTVLTATMKNAKAIHTLEKIINGHFTSPIHPSKIKIAGTYDGTKHYLTVDASNNNVYKKDIKGVRVIKQLENPIFFTIVPLIGAGTIDGNGNLVLNESNDKELGLIYESNNKIMARTVGTDEDNGRRLLYDIKYDDTGLVTEFKSTYNESGTTPDQDLDEQHPVITFCQDIRRP